MAVPSVDQKTKREKLIFSRPAGTDTSERTVGTIRPRNTKAAPKRSNHRWPRWISSQVMVIHRPQRSTHGLIRSSPNARASRYQKVLPSIAPAVPAPITPDSASSPCAACSPASDMMISDGIGGKRSEEHTSELQSLMRISYAVFCLKKKKTKIINQYTNLITNRI